MRIAAALTTACYCLQVCVSVLLAVRQVAANDENCTEFMDTGGVLACLQILGGGGASVCTPPLPLPPFSSPPLPVPVPVLVPRA